MADINKLPKYIRDKIEVVNGCWLWTGGVVWSGYSKIGYKGKTWSGHRLTYKLLVGDVPSGMTLDHICRIRRCINPSCLDVVTQQANTLRGIGPSAINAKKTHCPKGHPYSGSNLKVTNYGKINRTCVTCRKANSHRLYVRKLEAERLVQIGVQPL